RMYWADEIAKKIVSSKKYIPYHVDDMKTPSGFAHVGSLRGPLIHSVLYRALLNLKVKTKFTFVFNDFDPADDLPPEFEKELSNYMGFPLKTIPLKNSKFKNLGDLLINDLRTVINDLGVEAEYLSSWEMYHQGKFDEVIKIALDNSEKIQDIYKKVSGSDKKEKDWFPFQAICEKCGKIGTNRVYKWDGKYVYYKCETNLVSWAKGCGYEGKVSPFGGTGKLPWKVDWPAHWKVMGVTVEGAGKDHASAGGSYDIAMELCKEVFKFEKPYKLPYEFFLIGGKKMSSSKGLGVKAHDITKMLPPEIARFLFTRSKYKEQINFNPVGTMTIPDLFDEYDKSWQAYLKGNNKNLSKAYEYAQISKLPKKEKIFIPRFRDIANYMQHPSIKLIDKFEEIKEKKLSEQELQILKKRQKYAEEWLKNYAPQEFKMVMNSTVPKEAKNLSSDQKEFLKELIQVVKKEKIPEKLQSELFELTKKQNIPSSEGFSAIYLSLIGKERGPRAAWFILSLPKEDVIERFKEVSK
ncbi:lysine--tRNA ligase, partial [Patescibacteria group bacterium]